MAFPFADLADDSQRLAGAVGAGRVAGEFLVGEVGIVLERPGRLNDVDPLAPFSLGQLAAPDGRVQSGGEVDPGQPPLAVIGVEAGLEQIARLQVGAGAVVEGRGGVGGIGHRAAVPLRLYAPPVDWINAGLTVWPGTASTRPASPACTPTMSPRRRRRGGPRRRSTRSSPG